MSSSAALAGADADVGQWRLELLTVARAVSGGLLFGVPLLYTMEVWWVGSHTTPTQMALLLAMLTAPVFVLNRTDGFRASRDVRLVDAAADTLEAVAIGIVVTAGVLVLLRELTASTPIEVALGKVLYEVATGKDRKEYPSLPLGDDAKNPPRDLLELNAIISRACAAEVKERYASAAEMQADLVLLQSGRSVRGLHAFESRLRAAKRAGFIAAVCLLVACGGAAGEESEKGSGTTCDRPTVASPASGSASSAPSGGSSAPAPTSSAPPSDPPTSGGSTSGGAAICGPDEGCHGISSCTNHCYGPDCCYAVCQGRDIYVPGSRLFCSLTCPK